MEIMQEWDELSPYIQERAIIVIQFGAATCVPCSVIREKLEAWCKKRQGVEYLYISVEQHPKLCGQMGILSVPAVLVYVCGKLTVQESGYFSIDEILQKIERYIYLL